MPAYMKIGDIKGEATAVHFEEWFDVLSFSEGVSNDGRRTQFQDLSVMKTAGAGSPALMLACCEGRLFPDALLTITRDSDGERAAEYRFSSVRITSFQVGGTGYDRPTESLSLHFERIEYKQYVYGPDGKLLRNETMFFNV